MQNEEQVIDLVDYFKIIIKYKLLIVSVLIVSLLIGAIVYFKASDKYEVAMIVELKDATLTAKEISENINVGIFSDIIKNVNLDPGEIVLSVAGSTENLVKINAITENKNVAAVAVALKKIYELFYVRNKEYIAEKKDNIILRQAGTSEKENEERKNDQVGLKVKLLNLEINNSNERISGLEKEIKKSEENRVALTKAYEQEQREYSSYIKDKEKYMESKSSADGGLATYFSQVIVGKRQDIHYLREQIDLLRKNESDMSGEIKICKNNIQRKLIEIKIINLEKIQIKGLTDIKLLQEPTISKVKISKQPILMVSVLGGFMVGILLAFSIEFFRKIKKV